MMLQLIPPRLALFLLGVAIVAGGWSGRDWAWREPTKHTAALGAEGVTVEATVWDRRETSGTDSKGRSFPITYIVLDYEYAEQARQVELIAGGTPFADAQAGDVIAFRLHPADPEFLVHPAADPPSVILRSIPLVLALLLGGLMVVGVSVSQF